MARDQHGWRGWARAYRTPVLLSVIFLGLLVVFALTPDPKSVTGAAEPSSEPTPGPHECVICSIDKRCDPKTGQCIFLDHTPLPCVKTAKYDSKAGFCLPEGIAPAPAETTQPGQIPGPDFPGGIGVEPQQPRLPGFGN